MTFIDFLNRERVTQAAALLRRTNMQIQHIASAVGYNNTSYFTRQFVRVYSDTPSQYRTKGLL
jgi:two-component system response regulator YesN